MTKALPPKTLVLCTVSTWLDAVAEVAKRGFSIAGIVGLDPRVADPAAISGYIDISIFAAELGVPFYYAQSYNLKADVDRQTFETLDFDLIWVSGWQRLVPEWLISLAPLGVLGGHGSPDGIHGGRGRSPQNWALLLGCERFDLALFRITAGVDDGPVVAQRSFFYRPEDDIQVSYYRASLATADMICEVLEFPDLLKVAQPQPDEAFYYPQRLPEDGRVDWSLTRDSVTRHCRALTKPYPGLKTRHNDVEITLWQCQPFDDVIDGPFGVVSFCFQSGDFLVNCRDGRILVRQWSASETGWQPETGMELQSVAFAEQISAIVSRHEKKHPAQEISPRVKRWSLKE